MAAILPFDFEVGYEGFSGLQVLCIFVLVHANVHVQVRHTTHCSLHIAHCIAQVSSIKDFNFGFPWRGAVIRF